MVAGCIFSGAGDSGESSTHRSATPSQSPDGQFQLSGSSPTPVPGTYNPGTGGAGYPVGTPTSTIINGSNRTPVSPTPTPIPGTNGTPVTPTPSPIPTSTPVPVVSATTSDWGSDKDTYSRGSTATGWVHVTNTGNVPINSIDFTIVITKTIWFVPVQKTYTYAATGLNIPPGVKQKVEFSQSIPSDYQGVSTEGNYKLTVKASLAGNEIGSFSKDIKIV